MKHNNLSTWIRNNNFFIKHGDDKKITHLCLDGGKFNIPQESFSEFMKLYKKGVIEKEEYYICEVPTNVSRMYVDMDILDDVKLSSKCLSKYLNVIKSVIDEYYGDYEILVCRNESSPVSKNKINFVKTGVHLIWPNLYVKNENALNLSKLFVKYLIKAFGERHIENIWEDVIDSNVYNRKLPSLRMVGSRKMSRNTKGEYVDSGRVYMPYVRVANEGHTKIKKKEVFEYFDKCFLRVYEAETPWLKEIEKCVLLKKTLNTDQKIVSMNSGDPVVGEIQDLINSLGIPGWEDCEVRSVIRDKKFYTVKVVGSNYCLNKEAEHNNCGIYFVMSELGLKQKCYCRCDTTLNRINGKCSEFSSKFFDIPDLLKNKIFPKSPKSTYRAGFGIDNAFPSFDLLFKNKEKYGRMLANTVKFYEKK